jgi:glycogen synthase
VIAGDGAELGALRERASALSLGERVHLPGRLGRGQVAAVMRGAEVFVMPSRIEPFGIVALEAWAAGVPVVATPHGGAPEFIGHETSGLIADPFDSFELASAIDSLLASPHYRNRLAAAGRAELERFQWPKLVECYERQHGARVSQLAHWKVMTRGESFS